MNRRVVMAALAAAVLIAGRAAAQTPDTVRLTLGGAARMAAERNAQVVQAETRVEQARARATEQRSALLPQLSAELAQTGHTLNTATFGFDFPAQPGEEPLLDPNGEILGPVHLSDVRGRLTQTLFDWSALTRVRSANAAVSAADAQMHAAAERAASMAATAYVQALRARQLYASRRADVALAEELLAIARQQLESGTGVRLDVTRAQAQLGAVNAQLVAARTESELADLALARAIGLDAGIAVVVADSAPLADSVMPAEDSAVQAALAQRAELKAIAAEIRSSELQGAAVRAERLPSLSLVGDDGYIGKNWEHLLHTYDWGVQVSVPVFSGFGVRARAQEAAARIAELESRRRDLEQQVIFEVRSAILNVNGTREQVTAAAARLRLAEQEVADARERFESGVAGSGDVVIASLRLNEARTAYSVALSSYQAARVALAAAEGNVTELP